MDAQSVAGSSPGGPSVAGPGTSSNAASSSSSSSSSTGLSGKLSSAGSTPPAMAPSTGSGHIAGSGMDTKLDRMYPGTLALKEKDSNGTPTGNEDRYFQMPDTNNVPGQSGTKTHSLIDSSCPSAVDAVNGAMKMNVREGGNGKVQTIQGETTHRAVFYPSGRNPNSSTMAALSLGPRHDSHAQQINNPHSAEDKGCLEPDPNDLKKGVNGAALGNTASSRTGINYPLFSSSTFMGRARDIAFDKARPTEEREYGARAFKTAMDNPHLMATSENPDKMSSGRLDFLVDKVSAIETIGASKHYSDPTYDGKSDDLRQKAYDRHGSDLAAMRKDGLIDT